MYGLKDDKVSSQINGRLKIHVCFSTAGRGQEREAVPVYINKAKPIHSHVSDKKFKNEKYDKVNDFGDDSLP